MPAKETDLVKWEAAQWVERRMDDGAFDRTAFEEWAAVDPRHQSAFDTMWRRIMGPEMGAALHDYGHRKATRRKALAGAAATLLLVGVGYRAMPFIELQMTTPVEYAVAVGQVRDIRLADGTRMMLGGGARVSVRYTSHDRVIELGRGVLFARVVHDERRPFRIDTGDARIVDVGTSFEVLSRPAAVRVTVEDGTVDFARGGWFGTPVRLDAGEAAMLDQSGLTRLANVVVGRVAAWRGEWVEYKGRPLREVVADLRSLSPVPIEITGDRLGDRLVSGRIRLTDPAGQLENLSLIQGFRIRRDAKAIIIY